MHLQDLRTLPQVYAQAKSNLSSDVWRYLELGAGENETLRDNEAAYRRWRFRPRVMRGLGRPKLSTGFLGLDLSMPVMTAPFGADALFHPEGHLAIARANAERGIVSMAPEASSFSLEQIAEAAPAAAKVCQLHALGDGRHFTRIIKRAEASGYELLCVTVDCPTLGWREHLLQSGYEPPSCATSGNKIDGEDEDPWKIAAGGVDDEHPAWSWDKLADLCSGARLPFVCKGVLTGADALAARGSGAAGVIVSNHGGRQLDGAPAPLDQLLEVRRAVGADYPVGVDGGVRRGADVLKAMALGADVVLLGRAAAFGLAAAGEQGVGRVLDLFRQELETTMTLAGFDDVARMSLDMVQPADAVMREYAGYLARS